MQQIADWLEKLGLGQYAQRFAENDIDFVLLTKLTDADLKELGVTSLGHRKRLLEAIAERAAAAPSPQSAEPKAPDTAERRQVTVMFSDLVGSTALSARMDPEDLREVISAYQKCVAKTVQRFGGFVAKYMGDGVLVYFGYPQAHEDDAERAVRAGLELVSAVNALRTGPSLQTRVGIATGLVVVGDLIGTGSAQEQAVVGETPNLAARLQGIAEPNTVVIAENTRKLLGSLFELHDLGAKEVKGIAEPVRAWAALRPSSVESRFEAMHASGLTELVGREEELELLLRRWAKAKTGEGQVVLLSGEAGIGKSRIAETVMERLIGEPYTPLRSFCLPHHQDSALYPTITQLERAAGFRREDTPEQRLGKLETLLAQGTNDLSEAVPLLADLLSIPTGDRYPALDLTPQKRKEKTLHALLAQVEGLAARQPVLMVSEDVHWIDPTSRELLDLTVNRVPALPVLLIVTYRPEFTAPWVGRSHVTLLSLNRLPPRQRAEMISHMTGGKALPKEIADQIIDRTDGVPLFIEELTKTVVESGVLTDLGDHFTVAGPVPPLAIPTSLNASLLARLDRLAPAREVAQIGAALGRQFTHELISAVAPMPQQHVDDALSQLVSAELIFRRGTPPDAEYTFKHALVQDAAYSTLLRSRRQQIHARIVQVLEEQFPATSETGSALLAHHCTHAGFVEKAISYRYQAAQQATARSAMVETVAQLTQGLELLADLPGGAERDVEIDLQVALGAAFITTKGFAAPEVERAFERARELCRQRADHPQLPTVLSGLHLYHQHRSGVHVAYDVAAELLGLAERRQDPAACAVGHYRMAVSALFSGNHQLAVAHFEHALAFYDLADRRSPVFQSLSDIRVAAINFIPLIMLWRGDLDQAAMRSRTGLAAAHELGHAYTLSHVLHLNCWLHQHLGDPTVVRERAEEALNLTAEHGFSLWEQQAVFWRGWALAAAGEFTAASVQMRDAIAMLFKAMGSVNQQPHLLGLLAGVHTKAGSPTQALALLIEALAIVERTQERWFEAELHRLRAEALLHGSPRDVAEAEASLRRALAVAREQGAKFWELRAAITLARLWHDQGKAPEAVKLLTPVYGWFTEGFDTLDLKEAKALLDELRA